MDLPLGLCEIILDKNIIIHRMSWKAGNSLGKEACFIFFFSEQLGCFPEHYHMHIFLPN